MSTRRPGIIVLKRRTLLADYISFALGKPHWEVGTLLPSDELPTRGDGEWDGYQAVFTSCLSGKPVAKRNAGSPLIPASYRLSNLLSYLPNAELEVYFLPKEKELSCCNSLANMIVSVESSLTDHLSLVRKLLFPPADSEVFAMRLLSGMDSEDDEPWSLDSYPHHFQLPACSAKLLEEDLMANRYLASLVIRVIEQQAMEQPAIAQRLDSLPQPLKEMAVNIIYWENSPCNTCRLVDPSEEQQEWTQPSVMLDGVKLPVANNMSLDSFSPRQLQELLVEVERLAGDELAKLRARIAMFLAGNRNR